MGDPARILKILGTRDVTSIHWQRQRHLIRQQDLREACLMGSDLT